MVHMHHTPDTKLPPGFTLECDLAGNGQPLLRLAALHKLAVDAGHPIRAAELAAQMLALVPERWTIAG
jgi:hypothetical protein